MGLNPCDPDSLQTEKEAMDHYIKITSSSLALMKQQGKMDWLAFGDENNRVFFSKAKQRKLATYVYSLKDESEAYIEGFNEVGQLMIRYYKNLLGPKSVARANINKEVIYMGAVLSKEQQLDLCKNFTAKDIKEAIFSIPNTKSPGLDGWGSGFLKKAWG